MYFYKYALDGSDRHASTATGAAIITPNVYSIFLAGGGIRGGQVYGSSDRLGAFPRDLPTGPADVHVTVFQALGIPLDAELHDALGQSYPLTDGRPLPLLG